MVRIARIGVFELDVEAGSCGVQAGWWL